MQHDIRDNVKLEQFLEGVRPFGSEQKMLQAFGKVRESTVGWGE